MRKNVLEDQESKDWILKQRSPVEVEWWVNELQNDLSFETNSFPFIVFGTIMLIVSWLFFNGGSVGDMFSPEAQVELQHWKEQVEVRQAEIDQK